MSLQARLLALLPTFLIALTALWSGTFHGAATAVGAIVTQIALLTICLLGVGEVLDPLRLGRVGRWLLLALWIAVLISWWASPVARAGTTGLLLLPAFFLLPAVTARCWQEDAARRLGLSSIALVTSVVSAVALYQWRALSLPRTALPLGHHNLLAGWLILVLPLALTGVRWRGTTRWVACVAGVSGLLALAATGSLLAGVAITAQLALVCLWWPRLRPWAIPLASIALVGTLPRWWSIFRVTDFSALARGSYLAAAWQGVRARPATGWGPGAVPWTVAEFLEPVTGLHPPSQIVGDLHSLPAQLAYEIGIPGFLLALTLMIVFIGRRWRTTQSSTQDPAARTALLGLIGGGVFALGAAPLAVPALPTALAVVAGAAITEPASRSTMPGRSPIWAYLVMATALLTPLDHAHLLYDRARVTSLPNQSLSLLARAHELDPDFPLYLARQAWLGADLDGVHEEIAVEARTAAEMAPGLAPLWLAAGSLGQRADLEWAPDALRRAYELDPLSPLTAYHLMTVASEPSWAVELGVAAVRGDPRLAGALWWTDHPEIASLVSRDSGLAVPAPPLPDSPPMVMAMSFDHDPALSFSLYAFRRSPWPGRLAPVDIDTN